MSINKKGKSMSIEIIEKYIDLVGILDNLKKQIKEFGKESLSAKAAELEEYIGLVQQEYVHIISNLDKDTLGEVLKQLNRLTVYFETHLEQIYMKKIEIAFNLIKEISLLSESEEMEQPDLSKVNEYERDLFHIDSQISNEENQKTYYESVYHDLTTYYKAKKNEI